MHGTIEISDTGFSNMAPLHETSFSAAIIFKTTTNSGEKKKPSCSVGKGELLCQVL